MKIAKRVKRRRTKRRGLSTDRHRLNFERLESRDLLTFAFLDFSDISGLQFNGSANVAAGALLLTDDVPSQVGSVFYNEAMTLDESSSFSAALAVQMTGGQGTNGADGMAFVIQNTPAAAAALGSAGGGLGYGGIGAASIAIELDTYQNAFDPNNNNVSLLVGGDGAAPLVTALAPVDLNGGSVVHVWVDYDGPTNLLEVFVSSTSTRPASPLFSQTIDLAGVLGGQAYFGVSAATGGLVNEQRVLSWSVDTGDSTLVEVYAAGATSTEAISLLIDGVVVSTFSNVGGNYDAGVFQTLTYASPTPVTAEQVRVAFANDGTTPGGANRDVRIDAIAINGTRYESEASSVFSIGSGAAGAPDFAESEFLLFNGYFQYASAPPVNPGAVGLESSVYSVDEDAGVVNLTIRRTGGSDGIVTVDYRTFSDTAIAGQDFTATTGRAIFFPGQTSVTIAIPILNDDDEESTEKLDFTIDNVLGGASLRVPRTAIVSILDDENPAIGGGFGFTFDNFNSTSGLQFNGSASVAAGALLLTDAVSSQAGSVFYNEAMTLDEGTSFSAALAVQMTGGQGTNGADGMAFIIQNTPAGAAALGSAGGGLGYGGIGPASIAIELDTYQNAFDPNSNNVSLLLGGDGAAPIVTALAPIDLNGGSVVHVWVDYDGASNLLEVFVAGSPGKPTTPLFSQTIDLAGVLGNQAYFGVSAATGGLVNEQRVLSWSVDSSVPPAPTFGFEFDHFNSTSGLQFNGSASTAAGALLLTDDVPSQAGSVFYNEAMTLDEGTSFSAALAVQMTGGQGTNGADGMAFIIQNTPAGAAALGSAGGGLGYGGIGPASIAIELDTYQNAFDPNSNNVSLLLGGDGAAPIVTALAPIDLNGGAVVYVWVEYDGASNLLEVFVSGTPTKPATPLISQTIDLAGVLGNQAYFGVSAATGGLANEQRVLSWSVESSATEPEPTSVFTPETVVAGLTQPTGIDWSNDGRNMYIAEKRGVVRVLRDGQLLPVPLLDLSASVNNVGDRGMLDLAIHPDLAEHPYIYVVYAYDPPEVMNHTGLAGPDGRGNRAGRMSRFTLDAATNYTTVVPGSEVVMLGTNSTWDNFNGFVDSTINFTEPPAGILPNGENLQDFLAADSLSHTVGMVEFGPDGALYVSNGDGTSYNQVDARAVRVQDIDNLSGKILRLDPLTGAGLPDNPFYDGDPQSNRSKVYQYGFRNPFRFTIDATGKVYVGDVGWVTWEEVNQGAPGDNFGWPYFEGGNAGNLQTDEYQDLPQAQAFYASGQPVKAPLLALNHSTDLINAIVMGDRYDGSVYSAQYQGDLFFNDLGQGIVRNISFNPDGSIASVDVFAQGVQIVVQIVTGPDDYLYFVQLDNGIVGRWIEMLPQAPVASRQAAVSALSSPESVTGELLEDAAPTVDSLDAIAVTLAVDRMSLASSQRHTARERYFQAVEAWRPSADVDGEYVGPTATDRLRTDEQHIGVSRFKRAITRVSQASRDEVFDQLGRQHDWLAEPADLRLNRTLRKRN